MAKRKNKTSEIVDQWTRAINDYSPINISFITHPVNEALNERIRSLETIYERSAVYRFLNRQGVHPLLLFTTVSAAIGYSLQRSYKRSNKLVLQLVGVVYPTYCCWKLLKANHGIGIDQKSNEKAINEQLKSWLTYWLIFGTFQVLDHLMLSSQLFMLSARKKYNLYKLFILYWAQNPHSRGAYLLYKYVIQKPTLPLAPKAPSSSTTTTTITMPTTGCDANNEARQPEPYTIKNSDEVEEEELSIYIHRDERPTTAESYRYLDGFEPPSLYSNDRDNIKSNSRSSRSSSSNSTSSDDTIDSSAAGSRQYSAVHTLSAEGKETFSSLVTSNEAAWD